MAFKLRIKIVGNVIRALGSVWRDFSQSRALNEVGEFAVDRIYSQTKRGKSLVTGEKLKELSPSYKKWRRKWSKRGNRSGEFFSPNRSNLTLSGQLLDAMKYRVNKGKTSVTIFIEDTTRNSTNLVRARKNIRIEESKTNREVAKEVHKKGRPFLGLDERSNERVKGLFVKELRRMLLKKGLR